MIKLTKKEEKIMHILWDIGEGMIKDIIPHLPDPQTPYTTVSSLVRFLEEKQFIGHRAYGKTHVYYPLVKKADYAKQNLGQLVKDYFSNSYQSVISFLAKEENISISELKEIIEMIEEDNSNAHD